MAHHARRDAANAKRPNLSGGQKKNGWRNNDFGRRRLEEKKTGERLLSDNKKPRRNKRKN